MHPPDGDCEGGECRGPVRSRDCQCHTPLPAPAAAKPASPKPTAISSTILAAATQPTTQRSTFNPTLSPSQSAT